ncbi:hypothetical protein [Nocardioides stalactiti]|uniref:hypothetical protein n=1 Tax=Nocardioides stalactiti TaxID=2755356 RepID=UPI001600123E|nr:hypothetical protein [Nocardioides stalactiti]
MRRPQLTFGNILVGTAVVLLWTGGTAYAAATITGADIVDNSVDGIDVKNASIKAVDILDGTVGTADILDGTVRSEDISNGTITQLDLGTGSVASSEIADFDLTNEDIGVLFAEVKADGGLARGNPNVTATRNDVGDYSVDFSRLVSGCVPTATSGPAGVLAGPVTPAVATVGDGDSAFAVAVRMSNLDGVAVDVPFHLVLVC